MANKSLDETDRGSGGFGSTGGFSEKRSNENAAEPAQQKQRTE